MPSPRPAVPATATGIARSEGFDTVVAAHPRLLATPTDATGLLVDGGCADVREGLRRAEVGSAQYHGFGGDAVDEVVERQRLRVLLALINSEGSWSGTRSARSAASPRSGGRPGFARWLRSVHRLVLGNVRPFGDHVDEPQLRHLVTLRTGHPGGHRFEPDAVRRGGSFGPDGPG